MIHFWYTESRRTACGKSAISGTGVFGEGAYELVDCRACRTSLLWPQDPLEFPDLSTHPNHITNRKVS